MYHKFTGHYFFETWNDDFIIYYTSQLISKANDPEQFEWKI